ncbi:hypothetical protein ET475_16710 [Microbacterium protaetiae]|uniref:Uncharacterized protein n=1 Tax=Microbacterium protaetiae TaxID=2509458 RepID=A0A4P6EGJ4_9MICO|nr:hypothetical protein [Microbacterium protaetiae]QAY61444.1 hypothetical protein ET475_16710 [Microbacterium protaetiae]
MTAMTTRGIPARAYLAPPTAVERMLLTGARLLEASAHRRMLRRQQLAERIAEGFDPVEQRRAYDLDAARHSFYR